MKTFLRGCHIVIAGAHRGVKLQDVRNAGAVIQKGVDGKTTHFVVHEKSWKNGSVLLADGLERIKDEGHNNVKIVSSTWLQDCLSNSGKQKESPYLMSKLYPTLAQSSENSKDSNVDKPETQGSEVDDQKATEESRSNASLKAHQKASKEPRSHVGLMTQVLTDSTDQVEDTISRQLREVQTRKEKENEEDVRREMKELRQKLLKDEVQKAAFRQGAEEGKDALLSDNHHIYADETGFRYDVILIKIDKRTNSNERKSLTIYEHNAEPTTYAFNVVSAGGPRGRVKTIIVPPGTEFLPTFHAFKQSFRESTHVEWDHRIEAAKKRADSAKLARELATGKGVDDTGHSGRERSASVAASRTELNFADAPFIYEPPKKGPKGRVPGGDASHQQTSAQMQTGEMQTLEQGETAASGQVERHSETNEQATAHKGNEQPSAKSADSESVIDVVPAQEASVALKAAIDSPTHDGHHDLTKQQDDLPVLDPRQNDVSTSALVSSTDKQNEMLQSASPGANDATSSTVAEEEEAKPQAHFQGPGEAQIVEHGEVELLQTTKPRATDSMSLDEQDGAKPLPTIETKDTSLKPNLGPSMLGKRKKAESDTGAMNAKKPKMGMDSENSSVLIEVPKTSDSTQTENHEELEHVSSPTMDEQADASEGHFDAAMADMEG